MRGVVVSLLYLMLLVLYKNMPIIVATIRAPFTVFISDVSRYNVRSFFLHSTGTIFENVY
jgi:hypothetical protein